MHVELRSADLAEIAEAAVEEMRPEAERKHIALVFSAACTPPVPVDATRVAQLLGNLISNAVKFTPNGGKVEVKVGADGEKAVLEVADTGVGIPVADRDRIFDRPRKHVPDLASAPAGTHRRRPGPRRRPGVQSVTGVGYKLDRRRPEISQNATSATMPTAPMSSVCQRWLLGSASA